MSKQPLCSRFQGAEVSRFHFRHLIIFKAARFYGRSLKIMVNLPRQAATLAAG
jgi:hypothetical protein